MVPTVLAFASTLFARGHHRAVVAACSGALRDHADIRLLVMRARALLALELVDAARRDLRAALRIEPACKTACRLLAEIAPEHGRASRPSTNKLPNRFGRYLVFEKLGQGGVASVHRAELDGRAVALKRLLPVHATDPDAVASFVHEGRLARRLDHPGIPRVVDLGTHAGVDYIATELVHGPTLRDLMRRGVLPVRRVVAILIQLADALDHAHTACDDDGQPLGIVHRDVSPSNVIVTRSGVTLIDFGIARSATRSFATQTGIIKGKPAYLAPESLSGEIDARTDLFALGVIAHELLTGRPLFQGADDHTTVTNVLWMPIAPPSETNRAVTDTLDDIVLLALCREPAQRWQSAAALRTALQGARRELRDPRLGSGPLGVTSPWGDKPVAAAGVVDPGEVAREDWSGAGPPADEHASASRLLV